MTGKMVVQYLGLSGLCRYTVKKKLVIKQDLQLKCHRTVISVSPGLFSSLPNKFLVNTAYMGLMVGMGVQTLPRH